MINQSDIEGMKTTLPKNLKVGDIVTIQYSTCWSEQGEVEEVYECGSVRLKGSKLVGYPL